LIVSSGAVSLGKRALRLHKKPIRLEQKQAAAAVGQVELTHAYQAELAKHSLTVGQILLTKDDTETRKRYLNVRETADMLLSAGAIPMFNENDAVSDGGFRFGDNDRLAARIAGMTCSDLLILLSDIDGLYTSNPVEDPNAKPVPYIEEITPEIEKYAGGSGSEFGTGGMVTKIIAAKIAVNAGCGMMIADGKPHNPLTKIAEGAPHSFFAARCGHIAARKLWIAGAPDVAGFVTVDQGAENALNAGKSLLPSGVTGVTGIFSRGDCIGVRNPNGAEIARGLSIYSSEEINKIKGSHSGSIEKILGYQSRSEIIHRNDLTVFSS
jgi:glutamate 5-kinase